MRKALAAGFAAFAAMALTGCGYFPASFGPGSTAPAFIYTSGLTYPAENNTSSVYNFDTDDFDMIGTVTSEGESVNIFGIIAEGDNGYTTLLEDAMAMGGDDVINIRMDVTTTNILFYNTVSTKLMGTVVSYK